MADEDELIKPKAFVVLKSADKACDEFARALQEHCKQKLAPYKYPRWIEFRPDLPKTATGKIQRFKLRAESTSPMETEIPRSRASRASSRDELEQRR